MSAKRNFIKKSGTIALATVLVGSSLLNTLPFNVYASEAGIKAAALKAAPANATEVATYDQLKTALLSANVTDIKLTADIDVTSSFNFTSAKNLYGNGHTINMNDYRIGIAKASSVNRIEDLTITNQDIYPLFWSEYSGVQVTYKNVTSSGEQFVYNNAGTTILEGNIEASSTREEVYQGTTFIIRSGANVNFSSTSGCPALRVYGSVTQEANSDFKVNSKDYAIYGHNSNTQISVAGNMELSSTDEQAIYTSGSGGNMVVKSGAKFKATSGDKVEEAISLTSGNLTVESGSDFVVNASGVQGAVQTGGKLVFENGSNFAITNTNNAGSVFANYAGSSTNININSDKGLSTWDSGSINTALPTHNYNDFTTATFDLSGWDKSNLSQKNLTSNSAQFKSQFVSKTTGKLFGGSYAMTHIAQTTIDDLTTDSTKVTGSAEPNATITIKNAAGVTLGTGRVGSDGYYEVTIPKQAAGTEVTATATSNGISSSAKTTVKQATIAQTTIAALTTDSTIASGTAEPNAAIEILANGEVIGSGTVGSDGKYNITISQQDVGTRVTATVTKGTASSSATTTVTQGSIAQTTIAGLTTKSTVAEGTAEPNSTIVIKNAAGDTLGSGRVGSDGKYSITIPKQSFGTIVTATATKDGKTSTAQTTVIRGEIADTTISKVTTETTNVSGTAEPNATIVLTDQDGNVLKSGRVGSDGAYSMTIAKQAEGTVITATASADGFTSTASTIVERDGIDQTTIDTLTTESTTVSGTAEPNATIVIKDQAGNELKSGRVGSDGIYSLTIAKQAAGTVVTATATKDGKTSSAQTTVVDDSIPAAPTVNEVLDTATVVSGKALPNADVTVKIGNATYTGKANAQGNYSITIDKQAAGTDISVTQKNPINNRVSAPKTVKVKDTTLGAPTIAAVSVGDTTVEVTAEPGAKVNLTLPGGSTMSAVANDAGKAVFTISPAAKNNDVFSATQTGANGKASPAASVTVIASVVKTIIINENITTAFTGTTQQFTATTTPEGEAVTWSTSNSNFATVNKTTGLVTFKAPGTVTITAKLADGTAATKKIVVSNATPDVVEAPIVATDIYTTTTSVSGTAVDASQVIAYVNGLQIGSATVAANGSFTMPIPAQAANQTIAFVAENAKKTVSQPTNVTVKATTIKINEDITTAYTGTTKQLTATTTPAGQDVAWSTSNSNFATVNKTTGLVTFKAPGTVTITAKLADGTAATKKIVVSNQTVAAPVVSTVVYDNTTSASGTAPAGKVTAYVNGLPIGSVAVAADGTFKVNFPKQPAGTIINFVAEDAQGTTSAPTAVTVKGSTVKINEDVTAGLVGDSTTLTATSTPAGQAVTWSTSSAAIATVSSTGVVAYTGPGTVTITAKLANGATATKTIVVSDLPQPKLSDVKATDTVVNGTIDTSKYDVKQILILVNGVNKTIVNVTDGKFSASIGVQPTGTVIEARYKDKDGNYLTADKYVGKTTVKSAVSDNINVNDVNSLQKVVTGKSTVANAQVRLFVDGVQKRTSTTDADGNYSFSSGYLKEGQVVKVELRENGVVTGTAETVVVKATEEMVLDDVTTSDRFITGKGTENTQFRLTVNGVTKTVVTSDADGLFSFSTKALPAGTVVKVEMKSAGTYSVSEETTVIAGEVSDNDLTLDQTDVGDTKVTGTTKQPSTQVRLSINGSTKSTATTNASGEYTFTVPALKKGDVVKVEMKVDEVYAVSKQVTTGDGSGSDTPDATLNVDALLDTATTVTGKTEPNSQVRISLNDVTKSVVTSDDNGNFSYYIGTLVKDDVVKVELSVNGAYSVSKEVTVTSDDAAKALTVNPVIAADKKVTGTATASASLRISLNGATKSIIAADAEGNFSYNLSKLVKGDVIKVEMKVNNVWAVTKEVTVQ
ncbi:Ig-like domain-containing protein [Listeria booriae]|uniref:Ig-like domain-containing protein n=1 Tax=Listeria booriae TaxID=1552123 RepID=UPI001628E338|nr:Ig-like domain-containing protein [Listeria booriae]MBC1984189.1 autolysin modifier protein [Listeria booriae]